jgi:hypothetical protein
MTPQEQIQANLLRAKANWATVNENLALARSLTRQVRSQPWRIFANQSLKQQAQALLNVNERLQDETEQLIRDSDRLLKEA